MLDVTDKPCNVDDRDKADEIDMEPEVRIRKESLTLNPFWVQGKKSSVQKYFLININVHFLVGKIISTILKASQNLLFDF